MLQQLQIIHGMVRACYLSIVELLAGIEAWLNRNFEGHNPPRPSLKTVMRNGPFSLLSTCINRDTRCHHDLPYCQVILYNEYIGE